MSIYGYDWPPFVTAPAAVRRTRRLRHWYLGHPLTRPLRHRLAADWRAATPEAKGQRRPGRANRMVVTPAPTGPARLRVWKAIDRQHRDWGKRVSYAVRKTAEALGEFGGKMASALETAREALERLTEVAERALEAEEES